MSSPLLVVGEEGGQSNVTLLASPTSAESVCQNVLELKERNYLRLSNSAANSSLIAVASYQSKSTGLHLKATELRLGLPGSQSPERSAELPSLSTKQQLDEKLFFPLYPSNDGYYSSVQKNVVSGNKRGFSDTMNGFSEAKFLPNTEVSVMLSPRPTPNLILKPGSTHDNSGAQSAKAKDMVAPKVVQDRPHSAKETIPNNKSSAPASKAQVVGWPPIRSFRKNSLATTSKSTEEVDGKAGPSPLFVKVSMDGAPYLRKVDLRNYSTYQEMSSALEKMFSCFTIGQYGSHGGSGKEMLSESKLRDLLHCSEYVLTYEDKDGDWMLVGDVPWEMFIDTCKRLRIMKGSDAIGLAPRVVEKCKLKN